MYNELQNATYQCFPVISPSLYPSSHPTFPCQLLNQAEKVNPDYISILVITSLFPEFILSYFSLTISFFVQ